MMSDLLKIRPITRDDTPLVVKWRNNDRVRANFLFRETFTEEMHDRWLTDRVFGKRDVIQWIALLDDVPIGSVYLRDIDMDEKVAEYGVFIGEDHAIGKGCGKALAMAACREAKNIGLKRLILRVFCDNIPALKSYEAAGYEVVRVLPDQESTDGERRDMYLMECKLC